MNEQVMTSRSSKVCLHDPVMTSVTAEDSRIVMT